jgi:hypothetical protein
LCDPISLIGLAVSGMSSIAGYEQQKQQADQQNRLYKQNQINATVAFQQKQIDSNTREMQEMNSAAEQNMDTTLKAQKALATNMVAAGESGAYGASSEALMNDINGTADRSVSNVNTNLDWTLDQIENQKKGQSYEALDRINSVKRAVEPVLRGRHARDCRRCRQGRHPARNSINSLGVSE